MQMHDKDGKGKLNKKEAIEFMKENLSDLTSTRKSEITEEELNKIFKELDLDGNEFLTRNEIEAFLRKILNSRDHWDHDDD